MGNSSSIILVEHKAMKMLVSMKIIALLSQEFGSYDEHWMEEPGGFCSLFDQ